MREGGVEKGRVGGVLPMIEVNDEVESNNHQLT